MRILMLLLLVICLQACTNENKNKPTTTQEEQTITSNADENDPAQLADQSSADEVEPVEEVQEQTSQEIRQPIHSTKTFTHEEILFSEAGLDALKAILDRVNEIEDGVESFAAFEKTMLDTLQSLLTKVDTAILFTSSRRGNTKKGAFDEVVADNEEMTFGAERIDRNSLEYMRRPKPLIEGFSGYKIELMTVYNKSLALTDELFKTFGGLTYRHKTDNSTTYYLGSFTEKNVLEDYLIKVVKPRFPDAKGVKFKEGRVTKYK